MKFNAYKEFKFPSKAWSAQDSRASLCRHAQIAQARSLQTGDHNRKKDVEKAKAETSVRRCELDAAPRVWDAEWCKFLAEGAI